MTGLDCQSDGMTTQQDPRPLFLRSVAIASAIVGGVRPDQHAEPTPCDEYNVQELLGHMVAVMERIIVIGSLGDPNEATRMVDLSEKSVLTEWFTRAGKAAEVWSDAKLLGTIVTLPFAKLPGAAAMAIYGSELTVHGWDLARATGQTVQWDDECAAWASEPCRWRCHPIFPVTRKCRSARRFMSAPTLPSSTSLSPGLAARRNDQLQLMKTWRSGFTFKMTRSD
jgi:uncharacterized protein (TIGR03086 family)